MNVEKQIINALEFTGYKVYNNSFTSTDPAYFVFMINVNPELFANDEVQYGVNDISLHFYCPLTQNTVELRRQVKDALQNAGFSYPYEVDASDEHMQHIVFEFEGEEWLA
jgi:hypothetical protein